MFEYLKNYKYIFVSGMQRSGTTICMRMIQYDLEISECLWAGSRKSYIFNWVNTTKYKESIVIHAPGISKHIHNLGHREDTAIIWMQRDPTEIINSAQRINWDYSREADAYDLKIPDLSLLIETKNKIWEEQKNHIKHWYEIEYKDLKNHPLWFEKKIRKEFVYSRQTSPNQIEMLTPNPEGPEEYITDPEIKKLEPLLEEFPKEKPPEGGFSE